LNLPDLDRKKAAELKLDLGDYYIAVKERWEATLLYSQVDKEFEEDPLGHEARYRNAKLAYYMGDFEWAQVQFDVLKASTSKLISNDAIDMSVFIMDNLGLDTNEVALMKFARADLFRVQQQYDSSLLLLREIKLEFPDHELLDDVIYREANIFRESGLLEKAIERYNYLIENYPEAIKTDNALFELADLYDHVLGEKEKASELYEKLFIDYDSSTFAVEARKRYRRLRGDDV
jgi:tetratricopeptide (TPR) repeat protein